MATHPLPDDDRPNAGSTIPAPADPAASAAGVHVANVRWVAALVVAACAGVLLTAAMLQPDPRGHGTHEQLGLARCGWLVRSRLPCPTCGMTTAFSHAVRGSLALAWTCQPAGLLMALGAMAALPLGLWSLMTGRPPERVLRILTPLRLFFLITGVFLGGWAYKLVAGLLSGAWPADGWS
ncbi:MAG: DUF2752 domain-containing protein [Planctomycetia bacterium]|nr:MAG: DUF2752 domain-containing protein [Planctomycetia bacterium]